MENFKLGEMNKEKFGLSVSAVISKRTWAVQQQRTGSISVIFINVIKAEMVLAFS